MIELKKLAVDDYPLISEIMSDVFDDDPIQRWVFGPKMEVGRYFSEAARALYLEQGLSRASVDNNAAVLYLRPNSNKKIPIYRLLGLFWPMLKTGGLKSIRRGIAADELLAEKAPPQPYYYIFAIGARKHARGKGYGSALMKHCIAEAEREETPIYLENSKPENLGFYAKHGFEVLEKVYISPGSPPMWLMLRKPRGLEVPGHI